MNHSENSDLHAVAMELRILVATITKMVGRDLDQHLSDRGVPIRGLQFGVMRLLRHERCTLSTLSSHMMLNPATLVPVIDALERQGLVRRQRDPQDRRRTPLVLTEQGEALIHNLSCVPYEDSLLEALRRIEPSRRETLISLVRELAANMSDDPEVVHRIATVAKMHTHREA